MPSAPKPDRILALQTSFPLVFKVNGVEVRLEIYWMSNGGPWGFIAARFRGKSGAAREMRFGSFCGDLEKLKQSWQTGIEVADHPINNRIVDALLEQGLARELPQPPRVPRPPVEYSDDDSPR